MELRYLNIDILDRYLVQGEWNGSEDIVSTLPCIKTKINEDVTHRI